ncbi:energy-coupling factor transporter transmembrane component T family protein [Streptococcus sciuri]|uniref:Energy-coupling factor transporter transmembrane protein EcfT n=1 Tax=Streptococcus sciuri TaxID=2973939 RepID=A0ABT2F7I5_9STRE|nr:energy-coupling factor transporter transmembrane component T [Streptococcus sciuri]MCS4488436.1 energy-coupling factor transporter transmembrane protein EcfT [Streptococcus sciuri]
MTNSLLGYQKGEGFFYRLSGTSKLLAFVLISVACMISYDTRLLLLIGIISSIQLYFSPIKWRQISFVVTVIAIFALLNVLMVYLFSPNYGSTIYGQSTVLFKGVGWYQMTSQELFYLFNLALKYLCTTPLALLFIVTTHPSQFASSLNHLGISYKIAYAVSLTLRYIPDVQEEFQMIKKSQQARGFELSQKGKLIERIKGNIRIIIPLIFSSLERIDTVSIAMEMRRFGKEKKRTWYSAQDMTTKDYIVIASSLLILVISIGLIVLNKGRFYNPWN